VDATMGRLVYLPAGVAGPDPDAFLSDVLTGWRRAQLAQNFSPDTARRRVASVLRMAEFVGSYPWHHWRVREHMARTGMKNSRDLVGPLRERGITLSESQIYRIVGQEPERIAFKVLVALCDIFGIEAGDLITYTATDTRQSRSKVVNVAADVPLLNAYRPVKARIVSDD